MRKEIRLCGVLGRIELDELGWYVHATHPKQGNDAFFSGITDDPHQWVEDILGKETTGQGDFPYVDTAVDLKLVIRALAQAHVESAISEERKILREIDPSGS